MSWLCGDRVGGMTYIYRIARKELDNFNLLCLTLDVILG